MRRRTSPAPPQLLQRACSPTPTSPLLPSMYLSPRRERGKAPRERQVYCPTCLFPASIHFPSTAEPVWEEKSQASACQIVQWTSCRVGQALPAPRQCQPHQQFEKGHLRVECPGLGWVWGRAKSGAVHPPLSSTGQAIGRQGDGDDRRPGFQPSICQYLIQYPWPIQVSSLPQPQLFPFFKTSG